MSPLNQKSQKTDNPNLDFNLCSLRISKIANLLKLQRTTLFTRIDDTLRKNPGIWILIRQVQNVRRRGKNPGQQLQQDHSVTQKKRENSQRFGLREFGAFIRVLLKTTQKE